MNVCPPSDSDEVPLSVSYDMATAEYVFATKEESDGGQRFSFSITSRDVYGKEYGELKCDMTGHYQDKYGKTRVQSVAVVYKVSKEQFYL